MRSKECIIVGYALNTGGYIWISNENKIIKTINITFEEKGIW